MTALVRRGLRLGFDSLVIDSPTNRNALSLQLLEEALAAVRDSLAGESRGLVIEHTGPSFCSGVDLKERRALPRDDQSHSRLLADLLHLLWTYPRPVVAAVDGAVRGGGLGLLACADFVAATEASSFAYSEALVGVAPALVMAVTVPVRSSRALIPHLLRGDTFDAATALSLGLVNNVVVDHEALAVDNVLAGFLRAAPRAQATIKRLSRDWADNDMEGLLVEMSALSAELFAGDEAQEGMASFAEHREPSWRAQEALR